ncbi:thiolase family protein [Pseudarthrobacter oxydans]|uniref:thiolase family protein n=1 Tax=Pseudarthrobacter oxydans TaxID=1671 RepID=UPI003D26953C
MNQTRISASADRIVVVAGARTPVGSFGSAFRSTPAHILGARAVTEALWRASVGADEIDEVVMGCIGQVGPDAYNARRVAIAAGLPTTTPAFTVNRLCGSGLQAIWSGAQQMRWGAADVVVAGGDENMSRMPFLDFNARFNDRLGDRALVDGTVAMLTDPFSSIHMGVTAENVARKYDVSRAEQDEFAAESQRRAGSDAAKQAFKEEIVPVQQEGRKGTLIDTDEHPRPGTTVERLAALKPVFLEGGTVTAGNASGVNDGAAAVVLMHERDVRDRGLSGLATLEAVTTSALEPDLMGYAPVAALNKLFEQTGLTPSDVGVVELNEAFAAQAVAVIRDAKLDPAKTNPYGGAIALGHPVGATGAILSLRVALDLQRRDLEFGVVTMCLGGGQALAALFRRYQS